MKKKNINFQLAMIVKHNLFSSIELVLLKSFYQEAKIFLNSAQMFDAYIIFFNRLKHPSMQNTTMRLIKKFFYYSYL